MSNTYYIKQSDGTYRKVNYLEKEVKGNLTLLEDALPIGQNGPVGVFYSTTNQVIGTASVSQIISLDTTNISDRISIESNRIYISEPATYKMSVSILVENLSGQVEDVIFFLKFNGQIYPNSGHYTTIQARKSTGVPTDIYLNYHFIGKSISPGDYVEMWWQSSSTDVSLSYTPATIDLPASPSVIVNLMKISN